MAQSQPAQVLLQSEGHGGPQTTGWNLWKVRQDVGLRLLQQGLQLLLQLGLVVVCEGAEEEQLSSARSSRPAGGSAGLTVGWGWRGTLQQWSSVPAAPRLEMVWLTSS